MVLGSRAMEHVGVRRGDEAFSPARQASWPDPPVSSSEHSLIYVTAMSLSPYVFVVKSYTDRPAYQPDLLVRLDTAQAG